MIDLDDSRRSAIGALDGQPGRPAPDASDRAMVHALVYLGDCIREHESYDQMVEDALRGIATEVGAVSIALGQCANGLVDVSGAVKADS